ncbi:MAG: DUF1343 domain-containing protein [Chitinophagia bacterium]
MPLKFGIDIILDNEPIWKKDRIAMLTNDAARTNRGVKSRLALKDAGYNLRIIFSPEHGIKAIGKDGAKMLDELDEITGLPVISLYGEKYMPTADDLKDIDILLFDIPDAGTRFYTYLWSMTYWIEAAAKYNKQVIVLDRPNPLSGNQSLCEGPMLDESISSFIGRFNIPVKHQCTLGELAIYFNAVQHWKANLKVIQCEGWQREQLFFDWHQKWVNPSPALQNIEAALLYPGICFFEATNVSVGRGTPYSFEWIGAEWMNIPAMMMVGQNILREDLKIEALTLPITTDGNTTPTKGIRIKIIEPKYYAAALNGLLLLKLVKDIHPNEFKWMPYPTSANPTGENHLSLLMGVPNAASIFDLPLQQWLQKMSVLIKVDKWKKEIETYLLYN